MSEIICGDIHNLTNIFFIKKGMASKAFFNNIKNKNTDKIKKQIKKGTVKVYTNSKYETKS